MVHAAGLGNPGRDVVLALRCFTVMKKDSAVHIRVSSDELAVLKKSAAGAGGLSAWCREVLLRAASSSAQPVEGCCEVSPRQVYRLASCSLVRARAASARSARAMGLSWAVLFVFSMLLFLHYVLNH